MKDNFFSQEKTENKKQIILNIKDFTLNNKKIEIARAFFGMY